MPGGYSDYTRTKAVKAANKQIRNLAKAATKKTQSMLRKEKQQARKSRRLNPNTAQGRRNIIKDEKLKAKQKEIQARARLAEMNPEFEKAKLESKLRVAEIAEKGSAKAAVAAGIAGAGAKMAEGIRQENDDDKEKERQQQTIEALLYSGKNIDTSLGSSNGLAEGVE